MDIVFGMLLANISRVIFLMQMKLLSQTQKKNSIQMNVLSISFSHNTNNYCSKFPTISHNSFLSQCHLGEQIMDVINVIYIFVSHGNCVIKRTTISTLK